MTPTKQEQYNTLIDTFNFLEAKIRQFEDECELLGSEVDLFRIVKWKEALDNEPDYDLQTRAEEILKDLDLDNLPVSNEKELKAQINLVYSSLETFYTKQINTISQLSEFHEKEKFNTEVKLTLEEDFLPAFKNATIQIREKRREYRHKLCEMIDDGI